MSIEAPLRVSEEPEMLTSIYRMRITGLNVFTANDIALPAPTDPRVMFINSLRSQGDCSGFIGSFYVKDIADSIDEVLRPYLEEYVKSRIGLAGGKFYYDDDPNLSAFLPRLDIDISKVDSGHNENSEIQYLIECDSIAILVNTNSEDVEAIKSIISGSPQELRLLLRTEQSNFLIALADRCDLLIIFSNDGNIINAYSKDSSNFYMLRRPIEAVSTKIVSSQWFNTNIARLNWSNDLNCHIAASES